MQQNWGEGNNHEVHSEMSYCSFLPSILNSLSREPGANRFR